MLIDKVNSPEDIKDFTTEQLNTLAAEIRMGMMNRLSKKGGHFGPNFGFVEATIALHYVFHSPIDKIVYDVSHQCYSHKMLTGRKDGFFCDERFGAVSGYTNPEESAHDFFQVGHTSTAVSLACGLAKGRDLKGDKENHGGLYKNLQQLRDSNGTCACNLFKAMGLDYLYVAEGYKDLTSDYFLQKMKADERVVVVVPGVPGVIGFTEEKRKEAGRQFVDVGIAEEHAVAMVSSIARNGGKPVMATHSLQWCDSYGRSS